MRALGRDRSGWVVVVVNSDEPDSDRWDAVIVDVHHESVGPVDSAKSLFASQTWFRVHPAFEARAIAIVREATTKGTPPRAEDQSPAPITAEDAKAIWPELKNLTGTNGRAITIIGVSTAKRNVD